MIVFDSSALLAYARDETGADLVGDLLDEADVEKYVHAAQLCELLHLVWRSDGQAVAERTVSDFLALGLTERTDMDGALWHDAASLIVGRRLAGASLALGDAIGIALARRLGADFVTAEHGELDALSAAGTCGFIFVR